MVNANELIGIAGTDGSGKDTIGEMLSDRHGWLFISVTDLLRQELTRQNKVITRANQRQLSAEWRRKSGNGVLIDKAWETYNQKNKNGQFRGLVTSSLRNPGEVDEIHRLGGKVVWVDADIHVRYQRVINRQKNATEDNVTFEEFVKEEQEQMEHQEDEATLSLSAVKAKADIFLDNSGHDINAFKNQAEKALGL